MLRRLLAVFAVLSAALVLSTANADDPKDVAAKAPTVDRGKIEAKQRQLAEDFKQFNQELLRLAQRMQKSDDAALRNRGIVLEMAVKEAKERGTSLKFEQLIGYLSNKKILDDLDNLGKAKAKGEDIQKDLRLLLKLLKSDGRDDQIRREIAETERLIDAIKAVVRKQELVRTNLDRPNTDPKKIGPQQQKVTTATKTIAGVSKGKGGEGKKGEGKGKPKGGEGKDGKNEGGEGKDDTAKSKGDGKGEGKDGKSGEGKDGDGKGEPKDGKGKDGKGGEGKAGEPKDGKGGEGKAGEGKGKDGKPGQGKGGEGKGKPGMGEGKPSEKAGAGKGGEGKPGEGGKGGMGGEGKSAGKGGGKGGEGKAGEGKKGDDKKDDGKKGEGKKGDDKKDDGKPDGSDKKDDKKSEGKGKSAGKGQSKGSSGSKSGGSPDSKSKSSKGKSGGSSSGSSGQGKSGGGGGQSGEQPPQQPQQNPIITNAKKRVADATENQEDAEKKIDKGDKPGASDDASKAIDELQKAQAELEKLLRQLREEEVERLLANLLSRCQKMLALQMSVRRDTVSVFNDLERRKLEDRDTINRRKIEQNVRDQVAQEEELVRMAKEAIQLLRADGTAVAFPTVFEQVHDDMQSVALRLRKMDVGRFTQTIEDDIIKSLEEMIAALKKQQKENEQKKSKPKPSQPQQSQPQDQKLIELVAELKMIRSMQIRLNNRTERYHKEYYPTKEQAPDPVTIKDKKEREQMELVVQELEKLAERQGTIQKITRDIGTEKNK